jgi:hypothetical protein
MPAAVGSEYTSFTCRISAFDKSAESSDAEIGMIYLHSLAFWKQKT